LLFSFEPLTALQKGEYRKYPAVVDRTAGQPEFLEDMVYVRSHGV